MTRTLAAAASVLALAACATTHLDAQYANPAYAGRSLRGAPVLVACEAQEPTLQRICEDQVSAQVSALGGAPTRSSQAAGQASTGSGMDPYLAAARSSGARAIIRTTLSGAAVATPGGPTIGIGVGGGNYGYGGGVGVGGGVSFPTGGTRVTSAYSSETAIIDPANGAVMWSARASSPGKQDAAGQVAELARTAADAMKQAGLF
jgi:hypothetical protein